MLRRFKFLGVGVLTLACLVVPLSAAHAQHGRGGGSHVGSRSSFRPGFQPNFRGFNRREFDSRFNRFDRFEDRLERRLFREPLPHFGSGLVPGLGLGFGGFGFPGFFPRFGLGFPIL